jgi:Tol biopolymer transport system component
MVSVLTRDPDWGALPASTPGRVRNLLRRCLHKDPDRRLHDAADARLELEDATAEIGSVSAPETARVEPKRGFSGWMLFGAAVAGAAIAALLSWRLRHRTAAAGVPRIGELARLTEPVGRADWPNWSPDGSLLTYASDRSGDFEIYVRRSGGDEDINVTKDPGQDIEPAFSPDGNSIAFISTRSSRTGLIKIGSGAVSRSNRTYGGDLWLVPSLGGAARRLAPDANYPAWRPDGQRILYVSGPESHRAILEVSTAGGTPRPILPSHDSTWEIQWLGCSPDGRWVTFEDQIGGIFLMPVSGGKPTKIASGFSHGWDASSRRLWSLERETNGGTRVRFLDIDPERGVVRGAPRTVGLVMSNLRDLAVSRDARRLVVTEEETSRNLTRLPLSPDGGAADGPEEVLSQGQVIDDYPQVSPDGKRIAYISNTLGRTDVWILDLQTRRRLRFQLPGEDLLETEPAWMPNGKDLVVVRNFADEVSAAWLAALDGSHADEIFRSKSHSVLQIRCSPDGSSWLISELSGREQIDLYDLASRKMRSITSSPGDMYKYDAEWSPDGRWIALTQSDGVALQLFRIPAWGGAMQQLTTGYERMRHPFFSPDGKWIYVQPSHRNIFRVRAEGGSLEQVTHFPEAGLFLEEPTMTPDGRYLVYCRENGGSSLWLMTLDGGDPIH